MNDKLDELAGEIDDAVLSTEELEDAPGAVSEKKIDKMKHVLEKAQDLAEDLENEEDAG
jgi:inosine/xanthosine triphosphate pyrophosphatase family protein